MADAKSNFVCSSFLGGEWSPYAQGRTDLKEYKTALNVCRNGFPLEEGAWIRRSGTRHVAPTYQGKPARVIKFDFKADAPYLIEFTDVRQRFYSVSRQITGLTTPLALDVRFATTNDNQRVVDISTANPAVVQTTTAHGWATGDEVFFLFSSLDVANQTPLLCNRQFTATKIDATHVSLADSITGETIDGATLGWSSAVASAGSVVIARIQIALLPYTNGDWAALRSVQAELSKIFLHNDYPPHSLTALTQPTASAFSSFFGGRMGFTDGPYLDPPTDGSTVTPAPRRAQSR